MTRWVLFFVLWLLAFFFIIPQIIGNAAKQGSAISMLRCEGCALKVGTFRITMNGISWIQ